jgi:hypothetical protein
MILDIAIYTASFFPEAWYGLTLIHREFYEYSKTRVGILKYRKLFTKVEMECGDKYIHIFGMLNSIENNPAIICADGDKEWFINGICHRIEDKPAIIRVNGNKCWYINGKRHRENDQPAIICAYGDKHWYINGNRHRENDQPAGRVLPAVILANGGETPVYKRCMF